MKKVTVTLVLALFAFVATTAFAQATFTLRADVPFALISCLSPEMHQTVRGDSLIRP